MSKIKFRVDSSSTTPANACMPVSPQDMTHWPFEVIEKNGSPLIKVNYLGEEKTFSPQEISSMVLIKMKEISEAKLGKTVKKAVVT